MNTKILIIDDEDDIRALIQGILEDEGYDVINAGNSNKAFSLIKNESPDLVIQDIWLQGSDKDGIDILKETHDVYPNLPFLMISGHGTIETAVSAIKYGAYDFIEKPFKSDRLLLMIKRALENANLKNQNEELKRRTSENICTLIKQIPDDIVNIIDLSAKTNSRLLITGEVGTGKNVIAQYLHEKSERAHKPFMKLNCATTNPDDIEKELFGVHSIDDSSSTQGLLELANGGTLLLDEVESLPLNVQGKILNFLQDNSYYKIGSNKEIPSDIRVIATSCNNIEEMMKSGKFREDLYYRINVVPVHIPTLRSRKADIVSLIEKFSDLKVSDDALMKLKLYPWPGNVKQFNNVLEWLYIMYGDRNTEISTEQLPKEVVSPDHVNEIYENQENISVFDDSVLSMKLREARECFERHYLLSQVNKFDGNVSKTAEFIGMERSALHRKLKSLEVLCDEKQNVA